MLCDKCNKRETCTELCRRAEEYVNQDYIKLKEIPLSCLDININNIVIEDIIEVSSLTIKDWVYLIKNTNLSKLQKKYIYLYYWKGYSYRGIGRRYSTSRQNVTGIIKRGKVKMMEALIKKLPFCL